jgi:hypothetical protein
MIEFDFISDDEFVASHDRKHHCFEHVSGKYRRINVQPQKKEEDAQPKKEIQPESESERRERERLERERRQRAEEEESKRKLEIAKANAETARIVEERRRRDEEAAARRQEEESRRRKQLEEEWKKPIPLTLAQLSAPRVSFIGRTVKFKAAATCKMFPGGNASLTFYLRGRTQVQANIDMVDPKWGLRAGDFTVEVQGIVQRKVSGVLYLKDITVLSVD